MITYQNLNAWKISMDLVEGVYLVTRSYPGDERYGLSAQTRRAAVSIPANIAEGIGRQHKRETIQFLHIARGSLFELETLLTVAVRIGILNNADFDKLKCIMDNTVRVLNGLIRYMRIDDTLR